MASARGSRLFGGFCRRLEGSAFLRPLEEKGRLERYAVAIASFSAAFLVRETLLLFFPHVVRYVLHFPAVLVATLYGGAGAGLFCLALSAAALLLVAGRSLDAAELLNIALFAGTAGVIVVFVEALHRARASLRAAVARTNEILDSTSEAFYALDPGWRFTDVNRAAEGYWGLSRDELLGRVIWEVFPQAVGSQSHAAHLEASAARRPVEFEAVSPVLGRPIEGSVLPYSGGLAVFFRDISKRKDAERAVRERERELSVIYEHVAEAIFLVAVEPADRCRFVSVNRAFLEATGLTKDQVLGRLVSEVVPEPSLSMVLDRYREAVRTGRTVEWEETTPFPSGLRTGEVRVTPLRGEHGTCTHLLGTVNDVTERKRIEEEVRLANAFLEERVADRTEELRRTVDELETFAYTVAHDLRAPLRTVHRFAGLLGAADAGLAGAGAREYLARMTGAVKMMDLLIEDLLSYSRIGRARTSPEPIDVGALAREVAASLAGEIQESGARVELPGAGSPRVVADRLLLSQTLTNLLANALKFMPPGRRPEVTVGAEAHDGHARLWVQDNGIGIEPRYRERVFKVFERLHGPERYPGTGIGLAIVSRAVERMGGKVWFDSEPGKGSRFWVDLKLAPRKG